MRAAGSTPSIPTAKRSVTRENDAIQGDNTELDATIRLEKQSLAITLTRVPERPYRASMRLDAVTIKTGSLPMLELNASCSAETLSLSPAIVGIGAWAVMLEFGVAPNTR